METILGIFLWSIFVLIVLVAIGTWLFNRRPGQMTHADFRKRFPAPP